MEKVSSVFIRKCKLSIFVVIDILAINTQNALVNIVLNQNGKHFSQFALNDFGEFLSVLKLLK
jgi:hypothetical protein